MIPKEIAFKEQDLIEASARKRGEQTVWEDGQFVSIDNQISKKELFLNWLANIDWFFIVGLLISIVFTCSIAVCVSSCVKVEKLKKDQVATQELIELSSVVTQDQADAEKTIVELRKLHHRHMEMFKAEHLRNMQRLKELQKSLDDAQSKNDYSSEMI